MFYLLQMACDSNCTAEGSCWDLLIGCSVLRDPPHPPHTPTPTPPTLCVGAACWLRLVCVVPLFVTWFPLKPVSIWKSPTPPPPTLTSAPLSLNYISSCLVIITDSLYYRV